MSDPAAEHDGSSEAVENDLPTGVHGRFDAETLKDYSPALESADPLMRIELNDFEGGTLPFFQDHVGTLEASEAEDVLLFSHHPMHVPGFTAAELESVTTLTAPVGDRVYANFAGHYHGNGHEFIDAGGYEVFVTDATWDDEITLRVVEVWGDGARFEYRQELVVLD